MDTSGIILAVVCLVAGMAPSSQAGDIAATLMKVMECCPTIPLLVNETSVNACMPAKEKKPGFHMFGGSVEKNRSCVLECAFKADNLIKTAPNGSLMVDLAAIEEKLAGKNISDKWLSSINITKYNCTKKMPTLSKLSVSQKCTSGAYEVSTCIYKNFISTCPEKIATSDCTKRLTAAATAVSKSFIEKILSVFQKKTTTAAAETTTSASSG